MDYRLEQELAKKERLSSA